MVIGDDNFYFQEKMMAALFSSSGELSLFSVEMMAASEKSNRNILRNEEEIPIEK